MQQVLKNLISLIIGFFGIRIISFAATLYMTNTLGPNHFGILSSGINLSIILSIAFNMGLDEYIIRESAKHDQSISQQLSTIFALKLIFIPIGMLVLLVIIFYDPSYWWLIVWMGLYSNLHSFLTVLWAYMRGIEHMKAQTLNSLLQIILIAIGTSIATWITKDIFWIAPIYAGATGVALFFCLVDMKKIKIDIHIDFNFHLIKKTLLTALPFGINYILLLFFDRIIIIAITVFVGSVGVGLFTSVYNLTLITTSIPAILITASIPLLVRSIHEQRSDITVIASNLLRYSMILGFLAASSIYLLTPLIIQIFSDQYAAAATILRILAWSLPPLFLTTVVVNILETMGYARRSAMLVGTCFLISMPVIMLVTWQYHLIGATWIYIAVHSFLASVLYYELQKHLTILNPWSLFLPPGIASSMIIILTLIFPSDHILLISCFGLISFIGILFAGGTLGKADLIVMHNLFYRKNTSTV
ncbi:oligosaccharide flippase family protein [Herpetosiphon gulosus]|uniref:Polysaccharide biosynthesis protein n=1 Tax=Herpetosiphon gulosus TaxID=1973496 RepID=A0ABP9X9E6_9CHLR